MGQIEITTLTHGTILPCGSIMTYVTLETWQQQNLHKKN